MPAKQSGKSYWDLGTEGDPDKLEILTDAAMKNIIILMQKAVVHLVNQKDSQRLQVLQACTQQLYKQAELKTLKKCMGEGGNIPEILKSYKRSCSINMFDLSFSLQKKWDGEYYEVC